LKKQYMVSVVCLAVAVYLTPNSESKLQLSKVAGDSSCLSPSIEISSDSLRSDFMYPSTPLPHGMTSPRVLSSNQQNEYSKEIARGTRIFLGYADYLNEAGLVIRSRFNTFSQEIKSNGFEWNDRAVATYQELIQYIPTIDNPQEQLFVEVLEGLTPQQIHAIAHNGYENSFHLLLTRGCGACLMCGFPEGQKPIIHMPFSIAVKLLKKIRALDPMAYKLAIYLNNEPLEYYDRFTNATIVDVLKKARDAGFDLTQTTVLTHGIIGKRTPLTEQMMLEMHALGVKLGISFHMFNPDIRDLVQEEYADATDLEKEWESLAEKRQSIKARYVERFSPLLSAVRKIRDLRQEKAKEMPPRQPNDDWPIISELVISQKAIRRFEAIDGRTKAMRMLAEIELIKEEMKNKIRGRIGVLPVMEQSPILWIGNGAKMLQKWGFSDSMIKDIQDEGGKTSIIEYWPILYVNADGTINIQVSETEKILYRTVGKMFASYQAENFTTFLRFLSVVLRDRPTELKNDLMSDNLASWRSEKLIKDLDQTGAQLLQTIVSSPMFEGKREQFRGDDWDNAIFEVRETNKVASAPSHIGLVLNFFVKREEVFLLLAQFEQSEQVKEKLFMILKDIPFPTSFYFRISRPAKEITTKELSFFLVDPAEQKNSKRDIFTAERQFRVPLVRAFDKQLFFAGQRGGTNKIENSQQLNLVELAI